VFRFEAFPPGDRQTWEKLIEKELGTFPQGRPHPFYRQEDVKGWEDRAPLWQESGWTLVSDYYVPEEVGIWRYQEPLPQPLPPKWFIPLESPPLPALPDPAIEAFQEVAVGEAPSALVGRPVWYLPLRLTNDLQWENASILRLLPRQAPLHLSLTLDERFFTSILLLRALRKALQEKGFAQVNFWAKPASTLLDISPNLPAAGKEENLIRLTTYVLSAILGGAGYIYVPAIEKGDAHAERWSRNISHILRYEVAYLFTTPDPLAGSFFMEAETDRLSEELMEVLS